MDGQLQLQLRSHGQISLVDHPLHQNYRPSMAQLPQGARLFDGGHSEQIDIGQGRQAEIESVAVGISLNHRHDAAAANTLPHPSHVMGQGIDIDMNQGVSCHAACRRTQAISRLNHGSHG